MGALRKAHAASQLVLQDSSLRSQGYMTLRDPNYKIPRHCYFYASSKVLGKREGVAEIIIRAFRAFLPGVFKNLNFLIKDNLFPLCWRAFQRYDIILSESNK